MIANPCPGMEMITLSYRKEKIPEVEAAHVEIERAAQDFVMPEGMQIEERWIPVDEEGTQREIRIFTPASNGEKLPIIMCLHGGGWRVGDIRKDDYRWSAIAARVPAIVVTVDYRLVSKEVCYPVPLMDCYGAFQWIHAHAEELGGDPERIGMMGNSAGGNLVAGLSLYNRDHNGPKSAYTVLVCPPLSVDFTKTTAFHQWYDYKVGRPEPKLFAEPNYLGGYNGYMAPYYAFPLNCQDLAGLEPHMVVVAEYDALRDDGLRYANRLLEHGVQCDIYCASRVPHCYNRMPHPYSDLLHDLIAAGFQREFHMKPYW